MRDQEISAALQDIVNHEGIVPRMYLDTRSHVTVGIGELINSAEDACSRPFVNAATNKAATEDEIMRDFDRVVALGQSPTPPYRKASYYATEAPPIFLPVGYCRSNARRRLELEFIPAIAKFLPDLESYPLGVIRAVCDMAWSLGAVGLAKGYPKMLKAIRSKNWLDASKECKRDGASDPRNYWTRIRFISAADSQ